MDLKEIDILGNDINTHWYYISKSNAVLKLMRNETPEKIMDVGAGSGYFSKVLLNCTQVREAWCVDISYKKDEHLTVNGKPVHFLREIEYEDVDLVMLMDVLEHVDNDVALLTEYINKVPSGTKFLISVPALKWLWSPHDDFLEHKRRYTIAQIENTARDAGLTVHKSCYYFSLVLPLAIMTRMLSRFRRQSSIPCSQLKKHHVITNKCLRILCKFEEKFFKCNRIAGLTVFCYAEKK